MAKENGLVPGVNFVCLGALMQGPRWPNSPSNDSNNCFDDLELGIFSIPSKTFLGPKRVLLFN